MAVELIINMISPMMFLNGVKYIEVNLDYDNYIVEYEVNDILLWVCSIRFYLLSKLLLYYTYFMSPRA